MIIEREREREGGREYENILVKFAIVSTKDGGKCNNM
jgi:hypothetical protein